tara:strand:- start:893 stop:1525 length:633 start_codon:yes stop_codon:yes gene_type:complete
MSLGCYVISKKKILINKESVKKKSCHVSPKKIIINKDSIFVYGDEDENQLIEKILSVEGVHRIGVFSLIFVTLNIYYKDRVINTLNKLKKLDINTYNEIKLKFYSDNENKESSETINNFFKDKNYAYWIPFILMLGAGGVGIICFIFYFTDTRTVNWKGSRIIYNKAYIMYSALSFFIMFVTAFYLWKNNFFIRNSGEDIVDIKLKKMKQ